VHLKALLTDLEERWGLEGPGFVEGGKRSAGEIYLASGTYLCHGLLPTNERTVQAIDIYFSGVLVGCYIGEEKGALAWLE
jgi:hypothetical protein